MPGSSRRNAALAPLVLVTLAFRAGAASGSEPNAPGRNAIGADGARVVVAWNEVAFEVGHAEDQLQTFKTQRAMAMAHLAMHDAVNAVVERFAPYALVASDPGADPVVAAAYAAHAVLVDQYPGARPRLDAVLAPWRARRAADPAAARGSELGERAAAAVLAPRRDDAWDEPGSYAFASGPGAYQTTPPWDSFVLQPGFRHARPFALRAADQLRPPPPPAPGSAESAAALEEVRRQGARESVERTADQSAYAVWWMEFAEGSVNRLARELVGRRGVGLAEAARLFALLDMSLYDAYVTTWDSKFEYGHWRPSTAIHASAAEGDPAAVAAAAAWEPMLPAPPFPEYVSAHAAGCASAFEVLRRVLGEGGAFTMRTTTAPPGMPERRFPDFDTAAAECADSRVRLGWHFRYATDAGLALGRSVASWVVDHQLLARGDSPEPLDAAPTERSPVGLSCGSSLYDRPDRAYRESSGGGRPPLAAGTPLQRACHRRTSSSRPRRSHKMLVMAQPQERISEDLKAAMKARDAERTSTLRMLLAELKNERIRAGREVAEEEFLRVVQKGVKQRQDAAEQFRAAGRPELAEKEEREAAVLGGYLPAQLSDDEVRQAVEAFVREQGLAGPKDLGKVMQGLLPRFQGQVDGKVLQRLAREALGA